jgi:beta-galactosidase
MLPTRPPGTILQELTGVEVEEYYALDRTVAVSAALFRGSAQYWAEKLKTTTSARMVETARFESFNGWIDGQPAVTTHLPGRGLVYYIGCVLDDVSMRKLVDHILTFKMIRPAIKDLPPGVELCTRINDAGQKFLLLVNTTPDTRRVKFPPNQHEYITGGDYEGDVNLPGYTVAVLGERAPAEAHSAAGAAAAD